VRIWDIETLECARVLDASLGEVRARGCFDVPRYARPR
jgi:hypothetical protein